jgi:hypothetical protein
MRVEPVRSSLRRADIDDGVIPGGTTDEAVRARGLERGWEVRGLPRAHGILERAERFLRGGVRPPTPEVVAFIEVNKDDVVEGRRLGVGPVGAAADGSEHLLRRPRPQPVSASRR